MVTIVVSYPRLAVFVLGIIVDPKNLLKPTKVMAEEDGISSGLKSFYKNNAIADITVTFKTRPKEFVKTISHKLKTVQNRNQKLSLLSDELEALAIASQRSALELVKNEKSVIRFHILWLTNQLSISGASSDLAEKLVSNDEVLTIKPVIILKGMFNETLEFDTNENDTKPLNTKFMGEDSHSGIHDDDLLSWGVKRVQAPAVWDLGYDGTGVRVGIIDTGVRWSHDAIRDAYIGTENYGWFDPEKMTDMPRDFPEGGHGTPCLGMMVGNYGFGVAPGAKWMACLASTRYAFREDWVILCLQFMLCPTDYQGKNKDCSKAPRVVSNSWSYLPDEDDTAMRELVPILVESDINFIFAIGNRGLGGCESSGPPGHYDEFIGVGMSTPDDQVEEMSSAGPGPSGIIKPDFIAPGFMLIVAESVSDVSYISRGGTSIATPITAGIVALMLQKNPALTREDIRSILIKSTDPASTDMGMCGDVPNTQFPNNRAGHGIINALKAINNVRSLNG